jgi:hypothetical protein
LPRAFLRELRLACALVALLTVAVPSALGPAMGPVLRLLGESAHLCQCGMKPGTCGCPECARLERQRLANVERLVAPILEQACDPVPAMRFAGLPSGVLTAADAALVLVVPRGERLPVFADSPMVIRAEAKPPTPPPRSATV